MTRTRWAKLRPRRSAAASSTALLAEGDPEVAGLVHGVVEEFAQSLAVVVKRLLKLKGWQETERIVVGGGMRGSRVGELAIGRTGMLLKGEDIAIDIIPIRHDPDEAGLIGVAASWRRPGSSSAMTRCWRWISAGRTSGSGWCGRI